MTGLLHRFHIDFTGSPKDVMTTAMQLLSSAASKGAEAASSAGLAARHAAQKAREHTEAAVVARKEQYLEVTWRFLEVFGLFFF